jgi:hypothetical protein
VISLIKGPHNLKVCGPILTCIAFPLDYLDRQINPLEIPKKVTLTGLVDTGAAISCIDSAVIKKLGVSCHDEYKLTILDKVSTFQAYDIGITIPDINHNNKVHLEVIATDMENKLHDFIIGRDLLTLSTLVHDGYHGNFHFLLDIDPHPLSTTTTPHIGIHMEEPIIEIDIFNILDTFDSVVPDSIKNKISLKGIVDTGAQVSIINKNKLVELEQESRNELKVITLKKSESYESFDIGICLPNIDPNSIYQLEVVGIGFKSSNYDFVIGRDILRFGTFIYDGLARRYHFTLSV